MSISFVSAAFFIYVYLFTLDINEYLSFAAYTMVVVSYNICWITQSYLFLDLIQPRLRSTANGLTICVVRLIGDSISPYWVGTIADTCLSIEAKNNTVYQAMRCTQFSFYPLAFVSFIGGALALFISLTFNKDVERSRGIKPTTKTEADSIVRFWKEDVNSKFKFSFRDVQGIYIFIVFLFHFVFIKLIKLIKIFFVSIIFYFIESLLRYF